MNVLISIRPNWCALIANGKKTIEVRKTKPNIDLPFKCYIYCTVSGRPLVYGDVECAGGWREEYTQTYGYSRKEAERIWGSMNGKIIGEFICDGIQDITFADDGDHQWYQYLDAPSWAYFLESKACLTDEELAAYLGGHGGYGWHISDLKIYDEPINLCELFEPGNEWIRITRPPQSWRYVEGPK